MPSTSQAQQKFMGAVRAAQKGEKPISAKVAKVAGDMEPKDVKKFASTKHKGLPKKLKKEGIHDRDITSASHTNVKTPPKGVGNYDPKKRADSLKKLADFGPKDKKDKKQSFENTIGEIYAVRKPFEQCDQASMVQKVDPLQGILGSGEYVPEMFHGIYNDEKAAHTVAEKLYNEYVKGLQALEEKKENTENKIKKAIDQLEKKRKHHMDMAKENPREASQHKHHIADLTSQIDDLMTKMERIAKSKKAIEKKEDKKEKVEESAKKTKK
jgi:hypothetical protein